MVTSGGVSRNRISIFLSVFDVHVNRSPIAGVIRDVRYQRGKFLNAMSAHSAEENEQNIVTVEGEGRTVIFKQIAGLIARRIVFNFKVGDHVACGQRVGLIKFGSRVDVLFDRDAAIQVKPGDRVKGGATVLALLPVAQPVAQRWFMPAPPGSGRRLNRNSWNMEELEPRRRESDRPRGKLRKGMYILPSLFTTANIAAGFYAILQTVHGSTG